MVCPCETFCPWETAKLDRWLYTVVYVAPSMVPWLIITWLPWVPLPYAPRTAVTLPAAEANWRSPQPERRSTPLCMNQPPVIGYTRYPYEEVTYSEREIGGMSAPVRPPPPPLPLGAGGRAELEEPPLDREPLEFAFFLAASAAAASAALRSRSSFSLRLRSAS